MTEILAPCGCFESLKAAVCSGADAVYFGVGEFNARRNAENFTAENLADVVKYCHVRGVRAYLALNTLVSDNEFCGALSLAKAAADVGIDGIIIQDIGLAKVIHSCAKNLPLHASTQMSVHSLSGVRLLKNAGYKRVVLARECSAKDISQIAEYAHENGMEIEIFVQGALCMSLSGQCLFSALLGGRSGNRGLCAGTCRLPFKVCGLGSGNEYSLSLKDMNLYSYFDEFEKMGIESLKIEGRMKSAEYIAMAVDAAVAARDNPDVLPEKMRNLAKIFSRNGFTDGYYTGKIDADMFGVRSERDIAASKEIMNSAHELYRRERQRIAVDMSLKLKIGEKAALSVSDGENSVCLYGDTVETAVNRPIDYDFAKSKLEKCGGTPYFLREFTLESDDNSLISASKLNALKSAALDELSNERGKLSPIEFNMNLPNLSENGRQTGPKEAKIIGIFHNAEQIGDNLDLAMYFVPLDTDFDVIRRLTQSGKNIGIKLPSFINSEKWVCERLKSAKELGVTTAYCENLCAYQLALDCGMSVFGGAGLNVFNSYAANSDILSGAKALTASYELTAAQINHLKSKVPVCVNVYGKIPLMTVKNCPVKSQVGCGKCSGKIIDRKEIEFPVLCESGSARIFSDRPVWCADRLGEFSADYFAMCFTTETAAEVEQVVNDYRRGKTPSGLFTRGLYYKGVM